MTDLEITRLCAEAMGLPYKLGGADNQDWPYEEDIVLYDEGSNMWHTMYSPLRNDEWAMALVKKFKLSIIWTDRHLDGWLVRGWYTGRKTRRALCEEVDNADLNRAICECVAKMQAAK